MQIRLIWSKPHLNFIYKFIYGIYRRALLQISNGQGEITPFYFQKCWPMHRITWFSYAIHARPLNIKGYFGIIIIPPLHWRGVYCFTSVRSSVRRKIFFSATIDGRNLIFGHKLHIQCRYTILWEAFLNPSDSYFLFADLVGFYTHWTYMRGYHNIKWALAHSSSCLSYNHQKAQHPSFINDYDITIILKIFWWPFH